MTDPRDITLVEGAVHNPTEPRHFMRIVPATRSHAARLGDTTIAKSDGAVVVKEVGRDIYDPVVYFPRSAVDMTMLERVDKTTTCPVKGSTEYFDLVVAGQRVAEAAWSYVGTLVTGAEALDGRIAFDTRLVDVS